MIGSNKLENQITLLLLLLLLLDTRYFFSKKTPVNAFYPGIYSNSIYSLDRLLRRKSESTNAKFAGGERGIEHTRKRIIAVNHEVQYYAQTRDHWHFSNKHKMRIKSISHEIPKTDCQLLFLAFCTEGLRV